VEDAAYVEKVLGAELVSSIIVFAASADDKARTVLLDDIAFTSIFFFLDPPYDTPEATSMIDQRKLKQFGQSAHPDYVHD
jgi:hypothetical protein